MLAGGFQSEIASLPRPDNEGFVWTAVSAGPALHEEDSSATAVKQLQG